MFLAKYIDKKQGEARVVDRQSLVRERLSRWLKARPSATDLAERGILGRGERFVVARCVVDQFLRSRIQAQEAELARIPPGEVEYSERLCGLLGGSLGDDTVAADAASQVDEQFDARHVESILAKVRQERLGLERRLEEAADVWARCAEDCRSAVCGPRLSDVGKGLGHALGLLEACREIVGASLKGVFEELHGLQRLTSRRQCLSRVVAVAERTEEVRAAVFACCASEALPLDALEEVPDLCTGLPQRSRSLGARRLRFVVEPLRVTISQELDGILRASGVWPRAVASQLNAPAPADVGAKVIRLCADLQRVQRVEGRISKLDPDPPSPPSARRPAWEEVDTNAGLWCCRALASPLVERFRQLFCRPQSDLCRMDKPDWAFKYLLENLLSEHGHLLDNWLPQDEKGSASELKPSQRAALDEVDLLAGLAVAIAVEARLFVRSRMAILAQPEERATLLLTLQHLVRFHGDVVACGGAEAGATAFADFDTNRPIVPPDKRRRKSKKKRRAAARVPAHASAASDPDAATPSGVDALAGGLHGERHDAPRPAAVGWAEPPSDGLMGALSHLKRSDDAEEGAARAGAASAGGGGGFGLVGARLFGGLSQLGAVVKGGVAAPEQENPLLAGISHLQRPPSAAGPAGAGEASREAEAAPTPAPAPVAAPPVAAEVPADEEDSSDSEEECAEAPGFLDAWTAVDAAFVSERLSSATGSATGAAWRAQPLRLGGGRGASASEEPEAFELATILADIFKVSRSRAECLSTKSARSLYATRVLEAGLQQAMLSIKARWNAMADPLAEETKEATRLTETVEEICLFFDAFPLSEHFVFAVDEVNQLRLSMLTKLAESTADIVRSALRRIDEESCLFTYELSRPLLALSKRLRPSGFRVVAQQGVAKMAAHLMHYLQRQASFHSETQLELFVANCGEDLRTALSAATSVLEQAEVAPMVPLWDSCALLALPRAEAERILEVLQRVVSCSTSVAVGPAELLADPSSVLRRREEEVMASVGVQVLSPEQAIAVLGKRPDLAAKVPKDMLAPLGALQDLLPASATADSMLQLSAGALQHLGELSSQATTSLPYGALGAGQLRGFAGAAIGGAGALGGTAAGLAGGALGGALGVAGRLRSTLKAARASAGSP